MVAEVESSLTPRRAPTLGTRRVGTADEVFAGDPDHVAGSSVNDLEPRIGSDSRLIDGLGRQGESHFILSYTVGRRTVDSDSVRSPRRARIVPVNEFQILNSKIPKENDSGIRDLESGICNLEFPDRHGFWGGGRTPAASCGR